MVAIMRNATAEEVRTTVGYDLVQWHRFLVCTYLAFYYSSLLISFRASLGMKQKGL